MAGQEIIVDIDVGEVNSLLNELANRASPASRRKFLKNAGAMMLKMESEHFSTQGASIGRPWRKLRPITLQLRRRGRGKGTKILQDIGILRQNVTGKISSMDDWSVTVGTTGSKMNDIGRAHQYGIPVPKEVTVHVPAHKRTMAGITKKVKTSRRQLGYMSSLLPSSIKQNKRGSFTSQGRTVQVQEHTRTGLSPWGPIPARPFAGFSKKWIDRIMAKMVDHFITEADRRSRGRSKH